MASKCIDCGKPVREREPGDEYIAYLRMYTCAPCMRLGDTCAVCGKSPRCMTEDVCEDCLDIAAGEFFDKNPDLNMSIDHDAKITAYAKTNKKDIKAKLEGS